MLFETKKLTPNMTAICVNTARAKGYPSFEAMADLRDRWLQGAAFRERLAQMEALMIKEASV